MVIASSYFYRCLNVSVLLVSVIRVNQKIMIMIMIKIKIIHLFTVGVVYSSS